MNPGGKAKNEKKSEIKYCDANCAKFSSFAGVLPALFTPLGDMFLFFQSTVFCVFGCIFHLVVVPNTEFRAHNQKLSLQKLPRITKKG